MAIAMVRHAVTAVVAAGFLTVLAGSGHAQFVLYDDFSSGIIGPGKWGGFSLEGSFNGPTSEFIREVENGKLHLAYVSWGGNASDSGSVTSRQGLFVRQLGTLGGPGFITGLKAKVTVLDAEAQDCPGNPETAAPSRARAQLLGFFFNDGTGGAGDASGNILGGIQMQKGSDGVNRIAAFVQRCANAGCGSATNIAVAGNPVVFTAGWSPGAPMILKMVWDSVNGKFDFTATNPATLAQESHAVIYQGTVTNAGPPTSFDHKSVRVQNTVENCTAGRKSAVMDALFDNVRIQRAP
jgi:hypothetical protein